jgi:hypothetical protein
MRAAVARVLGRGEPRVAAAIDRTAARANSAGRSLSLEEERRQALLETMPADRSMTDDTLRGQSCQ